MRTLVILAICAVVLSREATAQIDGAAIHVIRDCGRERWDVKTLKDADTSSIDFAHPKEVTVDQLTRMRAFQPTEYMVRQWFEHSHFVVKALLYGYSENRDREFVLYLRDPVSNRTMVSEIPDPDCPEVAVTSRAMLYGAARQWVRDHVGRPTEKLATPLTVRISGIGMYSRLSNQTGMSENGLEIHPVLSIEEIPPAPATTAPVIPASAKLASTPSQATPAVRRHRRTSVRTASLRRRKWYRRHRNWRRRHRRQAAVSRPA
jgi:hypothetical protein